MRILYLTAHLSDVDIAQRALEKGTHGPVQIEACAGVRDAARSIAQAPASGIVVDLTAAQGEPGRWIRELRQVAPGMPLIALVRAGATAAAAEALLAGADETLVKHREYFLQMPVLIAQVAARGQASARRDDEPTGVLVAGDVPLALLERTHLQATAAGDDWWLAPAEKTAAVRPGAILIDDARGAAAVVGAIKALRDGERFEPVVIVSDTTDDEARHAYGRFATACVRRDELTRLPDVIERAILAGRLEDELTLLRAKEQRLRALIETIPTTVALIAADATVQAMNLAGLTLIGARESAQIVGRPFTMLCAPSDAEGVRAFIRQVCAGTPGLVRFSGQGLDGEPRTFEFRSVPLRRDRDVSSALGVMRVVPADRLAALAVPAPATEAASDPGTRLAPPPAGDPVLDTLRAQLDAKQQAHDSLQGRLAELEAQRAVSDAAWHAVQSQLERTLLRQAAHQTTTEEQDEQAAARLERAINEKDAQLLALAEARDAATARFASLDAAHAGAQSLLEERAALIAQLQEALSAAETARGDLEEALAQHIGQLADVEDVRQQEDRRLDAALAEAAALQARVDELATARTQLEQDVENWKAAAAEAWTERDAERERFGETLAELVALRVKADAHSRDQVTLADVRAQMARLQSEADAIEQLRTDLADATTRAQRLQEALEDALGARADLQQQVRDAEALGSRLRVELEQARAAFDTAFAERSAFKDQVAALTQQIVPLEVEVAQLRNAVAAAPVARELDDLRARCSAVETERDALQAQRADLERRVATQDAALDAALAELKAAVDAAHVTSQDLVALERRRDELTAHADALTADLRAAVDDVHAASRDEASLDRERDHLRAQLDAARAELQGAIDTARGATDELAKLQRDRNDAVSELARERALHDDAQQQRLAAEAAVQQVTERLLGVESDLTTARGAFNAIADERNMLKQSLADLSARRSDDYQALDALRAREAQLVADLAAARATADAVGSDAATLRAALDAAQRERETLRDQAATADAARLGALDEERRLRELSTQTQAQLADLRRQVAELEAEREQMREALGRADAGAQLLATRHIEERDAVQRSLDELRGAFADADARWTAQRLELEQAVATRVEAHRRLADSGVVGLAATTTEGQLLRCNETFTRFCGYARADDLLTQPDGLVLPLPVDWASFARHLDAASAPVIVESCVQHPDGRIAWLQASATLIRNTSLAPTLEWTVIDASDRYLRLRQMKQSRRLDAIRELSVSAGQEVVEQLAAMARAHDADDPALRDATRRAMARAREVAQQLVTFAQKQARLPQLLDLNETVSHLRPTLRRLSGEDVTIDVATAPGTLVVSTDPAETEQWVTSLVVACRDALPAGGSLTVATRAIDLATAGSGNERRVTPVAQVSLIASGLGARQVAVPTTLPDLLAHRGGTLRPSHDAVTNTSRVDVYLPLVRPTRAADAPFPLLRTDILTQVSDPL